MSIRDYDLKKEIIIAIKGEPGADDEKNISTPRDKAPIRVRRSADFLPRRTKSKEFFITLYDTAQYANGADIEFIFNPTPTLNFGASYSLNVLNNYQTAWNNFILGFDKNSLKTTFKKIEDLNQYGLKINGSGNYVFTNSGFKFFKAAYLSISGGRAARAFNTDPNSLYGYAYKITKLPSFSAPSVAFTVDDSLEVYLMPVIMRWLGAGSLWTAPKFTMFGNPQNQYEYLIDGFYKAIPRSVFLNNQTLEQQFGVPAFAASITPNIDSLPVYPSAVRQIWRSLVTSVNSANVYKVRFSEGSSFKNYISHTIDSAANFPSADTPDVYIQTSYVPKSFRPYGWLYDSSFPNGLLIAMIKKADEWFYVWISFDGAPLSQQGYMIAT